MDMGLHVQIHTTTHGTNHKYCYASLVFHRLMVWQHSICLVQGNPQGSCCRSGAKGAVVVVLVRNDVPQEQMQENIRNKNFAMKLFDETHCHLILI